MPQERLTYLMIMHVQREETDNMDLRQVANEFDQGNTENFKCDELVVPIWLPDSVQYST
ncbi:hypothetical protein DPMN_077223 [Dreissena polymorpha]|uniref:Uncharacterized protein n=1 Tax=Dreissena polymorpha TaxID=45954 RepID=A0A9D3YNU5_DREPO|nr:hypothetical protein DPMN_077223 [Dreissena polymorpha]